MARIRIGLRHLYVAHGCTIEDPGGFRHTMQLRSGTAVELRIGGTPLAGVFTAQDFPRFLVPQTPPQVINWRYEPDISKTPIAGKTLTEIVVTRDVDAEDEVAQGLEKKDAKARDSALDIADRRRDELSPEAHLVAGFLGLRGHRQFVAELLSENSMVWQAGEPQVRLSTPWMEVLEPLSLSASKHPLLAQAFDTITGDTEALQFAGRVFGWLVRAWREVDPITRFLWFFLPLECVLSLVEVPPPHSADLKTIRRAIRARVAPPERKPLLALFGRMTERLRPSLEERFAAFARASAAPSAEDDIKAFAEFNRIRNRLLHRGEPQVRLRIEAEAESKVHTLEDLAERYVCFAFFRDWKVYPSQWRPRRDA